MSEFSGSYNCPRYKKKRAPKSHPTIIASKLSEPGDANECFTKRSSSPRYHPDSDDKHLSKGGNGSERKWKSEECFFDLLKKGNKKKTKKKSWVRLESNDDDDLSFGGGGSLSTTGATPALPSPTSWIRNSFKRRNKAKVGKKYLILSKCTG